MKRRNLYISILILMSISILVTPFGSAYSKEIEDAPDLKAFLINPDQLPFANEDIYKKNKQVSVPDPVKKIIHFVIDDYCVTNDIKEKESKRNLFGEIYKVKAPIKLDLYIFKLKSYQPAPIYYPILFDPTNNATTQNPPAFNAETLNLEIPVVEKPLIGFRDLDGDGKPELLVKRLAHNGTMYNAEQHRYFKIDNQLRMNLIFILDAKELSPYHDGGSIKRTVKQNGVNQLTVRVYQCDNSNTKKTYEREIGIVTLRRENKSAIYKIINQEIFIEKAKEFISPTWYYEKFFEDGSYF